MRKNREETRRLVGICRKRAAIFPQPRFRDSPFLYPVFAIITGVLKIPIYRAPLYSRLQATGRAEAEARKRRRRPNTGIHKAGGGEESGRCSELQEAGGGDGGGRYRKRAGVTHGRYSYRKRAAAEMVGEEQGLVGGHKFG
jgi:hypothetical protein